MLVVLTVVNAARLIWYTNPLEQIAQPPLPILAFDKVGETWSPLELRMDSQGVSEFRYGSMGSNQLAFIESDASSRVSLRGITLSS